MKTKAILGFFLLILIAIPLKIVAQPSYRDWVTEKTTNKIAQITVWRYQLKKDTITKEDLIKRDTSYTFKTSYINGHLHVDTTISCIIQTGPPSDFFKYSDTSIHSKEVYSEKGLLIYQEGYFFGIDQPRYLYKRFKYDSKNRIIEEINYNKDSTQVDKVITDFDDKNMTVRMNSFYNEDPRYFYVGTYNKKGKKLTSKTYLSDSTMSDKRTFEYLKNREIKTKFFNGKDSIPGGFSHSSFDKRGNEIEWSSYHKDSVLLIADYNTYNKKGKLIQEKEVDIEDNTENTEYELDHKGNTIAVKDLITNVVFKKLYYNKKGLLDHEIYYTDEGEPESELRYEYIMRK